MPQYRKKPVVIEAVQWNGNNAHEILFWMGHYHQGGKEKIGYLDEAGNFKIRTDEGEMLASVYDFIIRGVQNEFYACKPDIFEKTYELVEP